MGEQNLLYTKRKYDNKFKAAMNLEHPIPIKLWGAANKNEE